MTPTQRVFLTFQYLLPHHLLSRLIHHATRWRWRPWKNFLIRRICRTYNVDLDEVQRQVPDEFVSFNDFFTRELVDGARPLPTEADAVACPSDGAISQLGDIDGDVLFQAKGRDYQLADLLGGRQDLAARFQDGVFATVYLAPRNYHRVHMPLAGRLVETTYVPGRLFSVAPLTVGNVPRLFARNERLICMFDTPDAGPMAVILVGAMLVSAIETVWDGEMSRSSEVRTTSYADRDVTLERGAELGRFNMGSTVILMFGADTVSWGAYTCDQPVRMGQRLGTLLGTES